MIAPTRTHYMAVARSALARAAAAAATDDRERAACERLASLAMVAAYRAGRP